MEPLIRLHDDDIFPKVFIFNDPDNLSMPEERVAVKFILLDHENKLALVGTKNRLLPGGGVEEGETLEDAVKRECLEEVGCDIEIIKEIGFSEEWRNHKKKRHQLIHCFVGKVRGEKGVPTTTQEDEIGIVVDWVTLDEAIQIVTRQIETIPFESYHSCFNVRTHKVFLEEYKKQNAEK